MPLSCSCDEWEGDPGTWAYIPPDDFSRFDLYRRKRCSSCGGLIELGSDCLRFQRVRAPCTEIESRIMGEEIAMSPMFLCENCGEHYLNLSEVGYCIAPNENVLDLLREYQRMTGFKK